MAKKFRISTTGKALVPWHEKYTADDFSNLDEFQEHLSAQTEEYQEIAARLRPGEPHPMHYSYDQYESEMRIYEQATALDAHRARHEPPQQLEPDKHALWYGSGEDRKEAQERLEMRKFRDEQLEKAARCRAAGRYADAREHEDRAAQYDRGIDKREREY